MPKSSADGTSSGSGNSRNGGLSDIRNALMDVVSPCGQAEFAFSDGGGDGKQGGEDGISLPLEDGINFTFAGDCGSTEEALESWTPEIDAALFLGLRNVGTACAVAADMPTIDLELLALAGAAAFFDKSKDGVGDGKQGVEAAGDGECGVSVPLEDGTTFTFVGACGSANDVLESLAPENDGVRFLGLRNGGTACTVAADMSVLDLELLALDARAAALLDKPSDDTSNRNLSMYCRETS